VVLLLVAPIVMLKGHATSGALNDRTLPEFSKVGLFG
jgi:hypothetical protein